MECDLFAHQSAATASFAPTVDLFASPEPVLPSAAKLSSESAKMPMDDPFASVPLNTFQDSDLFGAFTSSMDAQSGNPPKVETLPTESKGNSTDGLPPQTKNSFNESKAPAKKDTFQVKSSIWADSLSRGLIDLNISSRKCHLYVVNLFEGFCLFIGFPMCCISMHARVHLYFR